MPFVGGPHTGITNPRRRTAAILEKSKNCYISSAVQPILTKFGMGKYFEPLDRLDRQKLKISKIQDGGGRQFEKSKNSHISVAVGPILTKFGMMMQLDPLDRPER